MSMGSPGVWEPLAIRARIVGTQLRATSHEFCDVVPKAAAAARRKRIQQAG
jgi:hypothetical protein